MLSRVRVIAFLLAMLISPSALAQGIFANGLALWDANGCEACHDDGQGATGLVAVRNQIFLRQLGGAGLTYLKSLAALNAALLGEDLDFTATGMEQQFPAGTFSQAQISDLATYIANMPNPAPLVSYSPSPGPIFPPTAVGASATQTVTITNTGTLPLVFAANGAATIATGPFSTDFSVSASQASSFCQAMTLQPGAGSCTVTVQFSPQAGSATARQASLALNTTAPAAPTLVTMFGNLPAAPPPVSPAPGAPAAGTAPPSNSGNSPSGGGALPWQALGLLLLLLIPGVRRRVAG